MSSRKSFFTISEILAKLVSFPTVTGQQEPCRKALDYVADFLSQHGMNIERHDINGYQSLVASTRPGNLKHATVWLAAHIDVVPAGDELFTLREQDGKLYGRGVFDMKFALATYMKLVADLSGQPADYNFAIVVTSDEEVGGFDGIKALLSKGYRPEVVILPDAGDTPGNWKLERSAKGVWEAEVIARGRSAHASRPWKGDNAINKLIATLDEIKTDFSNQGPHTSTLTTNYIRGGQAFNQVPDEASAVVDIRTISNEDFAVIKKRIEAICHKHGVQLKPVTEYGHAHQTDFSNPFIKDFQSCFKRQVPGGNLVESDSLGSGDPRHFAAIGVPCIVASPPGDGCHEPDEWVLAGDLDKFKDVLLDYLDTVAKK